MAVKRVPVRVIEVTPERYPPIKTQTRRQGQDGSELTKLISFTNTLYTSLRICFDMFLCLRFRLAHVTF